MKLAVIFLSVFASLALAGAQDTIPTPPVRQLYLHFITQAASTIPPKRIVSTRIILSEDISVSVGADTKTLSGRIDARGDKFFASVRGHYFSGTGFFEGEVELDKPFEPHTYIMSGGVYSTRFVLSASPDCREYLKEPGRKSK